jgi:outer membrane protein TolC
MANARILLTTFFILLSFTIELFGQTETEEIPDEITLSINEAIEIALINNYMLRKGMLNIQNADEQIREAWGSVYPQVNASGSYTRNVISPNPFAGSDAGGLFQLFGSLEWLSYNETARTDDDPDTEPLSFDEFMDRREQGLSDAGIVQAADDNPFAVDNQFQFGLNITQTIYNGAAFAAIQGARQVRQINQDEYQRELQTVVDQIKNSFYAALLAEEQAKVLRASVERLRRTVEETKASVEAGILSKYDNMSAEVELVNLETNLIEAENRSELAVKNLTLQLGIPVRTTVNLRGELEFDEELLPEMVNTEDAYHLAIEQRPDLNQAREYMDLLDVNRRITRSGYFPAINAFANAAYIGQVPDNRQVISPVPDEDFSFTTSQRRFFSDAYWDPALAVGIQLSWSIFDGFQRSARLQQNRIESRQAEIDEEMLKNSIYLEVDQVIMDLETAYQRIISQQRNIEQAQVNYENSVKRLREGIGTPLEERQASSLLDQSRLNYLSAVYDYKAAVSRFHRVTGKPVMENNQ